MVPTANDISKIKLWVIWSTADKGRAVRAFLVEKKAKEMFKKMCVRNAKYKLLEIDLDCEDSEEFLIGRAAQNILVGDDILYDPTTRMIRPKIKTMVDSTYQQEWYLNR